MRRTRLASAVWLGVWVAKADGVWSGVTVWFLTLCLFDMAHAHAVSVRHRLRRRREWQAQQVAAGLPAHPYRRFFELFAASALAGWLLAKLFIAAVQR